MSMGDNPFAYDDFDQAELPDFESTNTKEQKESRPEPSNAKSSANSKASKLEQLKAREAELLRRQSEIKTQAAEVMLSPNWPEHYPIIRYDPENDLPPSSRKTVKNALYGLLTIAIGCLFNIIAVLSVTGLKDYSKARALIFAVIQGFATVYVGINFSYTGIYEGCKKKNVSFKWIIIQFCFIAWCAYRALGFPTSGSVGIAVLLDLLANDSKGISRFLALLNTAISCVSIYFEINTLSEAQKYQKVSGNRDDEDKLNPPEQI